MITAYDLFDCEENGHGGWSVYAYTLDGVKRFVSEHSDEEDALFGLHALHQVASEALAYAYYEGVRDSVNARVTLDQAKRYAAKPNATLDGVAYFNPQEV